MQGQIHCGSLRKIVWKTLKIPESMQQSTYPLFTSKLRRNFQGFTLIELLTVLAIMAILVGLSIPAISGARSTSNRKTAVGIVMSTLEQARVAGLRSGENVYVILARSTDSGRSPDALIVVGDPPLGSPATGKTFYTHWIRLPFNIRFRSSLDTLVINPMPSGVTEAMLPPINGNPIFSGFTFSSTGTLVYPANGGLDVALYEGIREAGGTEKALGASALATEGLSDAGLYEVIRLSRYTGRSWMDVSTLSQK